MQQNKANMALYEITGCRPAVSVDAVEAFQPPSTYGLNQVHQSHTGFFKNKRGSHAFANAVLIKKH